MLLQAAVPTGILQKTRAVEVVIFSCGVRELALEDGNWKRIREKPSPQFLENTQRSSS